MKKLEIKDLIKCAHDFCEIESKVNHTSLLGITDGKAVGTYIEHKFKEFLSSQYKFLDGNSAKGIDIPDNSIYTDIKVTSITQPQSSCPFKTSRQKIYGLGYNLLLFVYDKKDENNICILNFKHCAFIYKHRTADYSITKRLIEMLNDSCNKEDIISFLSDRNIPGDDIIYNNLADELLTTPPEQGYLTISNALQWRLQYGRVVSLNNNIQGVVNYDWG